MPAAISEDSPQKKQREAKEDMAGISFSDNYNTGTGTNANKENYWSRLRSLQR